MASISGTVTVAGDPDDWIACAFDADTHAYAGSAAVAAGAYEITGLIAGKAYMIACRCKTGGVWQADFEEYVVGDYVIPTDPVTTPYLYKATAAEPGDLEWNNVTLSINGNGANNSTDFSSADAKSHTVSGNGNVKYSTTQYKYGTASIYFDGTGDYLTVSDSTDFSLTTSQSVTFECWFYCTDASVNRTLFTIYTIGSWGRLLIQTTGPKISFSFGTNWSIIHNTYVTLNAWHHVALVRNGSTWTVYLDGVASGTNTAGNSVDPANLYLGVDPSQPTWAFSGYLDDIRLTKGVARYTANFDVPTIENPQLLGIPTGSTEPEWPTTDDQTVEDGGVTWTCKGRMVQPLLQGPLIAA